MASFNPGYESSYKSQQQSASNWDSHPVNGVWNSASLHAINNLSTTSTSQTVIPNKTTGSTDEDDWEPVISDFTNRNNLAASIISPSEEEEWTLGDGNNQYGSSYVGPVSPQISQNDQFFACDENIDEGFMSMSEENASPNQLDAGQEELSYDDSSYMDTSEDCFEESIQEDAIAEHEMPTTFRKRPVKRDWCGNPVFQDDWRLGAGSAAGFSSKSSFSFNSGGDCDTFKKRCRY